MVPRFSIANKLQVHSAIKQLLLTNNLPSFRLPWRRYHDTSSTRQRWAIMLHAGSLRYTSTVTAICFTSARKWFSPWEILWKPHLLCHSVQYKLIYSETKCTWAMLELASEADLDDDALWMLLSHPFSSVPPISSSQSPKLFFLMTGVLSWLNQLFRLGCGV